MVKRKMRKKGKNTFKKRKEEMGRKVERYKV